MKEQLNSLITAITLLVLSLTIGVVGYRVIEGYDLLNAFYMAVITISTVGFTEVYELSPNGRLFTAFYIIFNFGAFAYAISIVTSYLFEGKLKSFFSDYMNVKKINKLSNHVIVCGYGRNGSQACKELVKEGRDFIVIDKDPSEAQIADASGDNFQILDGDATEDAVLKKAGIERASEIIVATTSDASNVFITLTARELKPSITIIARAAQKETERKLYRAGADKVVLPAYLGGTFMAQMVTKPVVIEFLNLLTGNNRDLEKYHLESIHYKDLKPQYRDKTLKELDIKHLTGTTVVAVKDSTKGMIPSPSSDTFIGVDDTIIILCSEHNVKRLFEVMTE